MEKILLLLVCLLLVSPSLARAEIAYTNSMSPYTEAADPDTFYNGATFVIDSVSTGETPEAFITRELEAMQTYYHINTINIYGLEGQSDAVKEHLFAELKRLNMRIVVRIESYSGSFAFQVEDLEWIIDYYGKLLDFVCQPDNQAQVAYFSLNMPVDDGSVTSRIGGVNSEECKSRQVSYTAAFVQRMRQETETHGFTDAKMFLSIFYGWDNTYQLPSYADAGADGYFINNYSYPARTGVYPDATADADTLINAKRLAISLDHFQEMYPGMPLVVESGFHTLEYNNWVPTNQTAGLVYDRAAKAAAVRAAVNFYQQNYPDVMRGMLYFGFNLFKQEGNPAAVMDWALNHAPQGFAQAEDAYYTGSAAATADENAEGSVAVQMNAGDGITWYNCRKVSQVGVRYRCEEAAQLRVLVNGQEKQILALPASAEYTTVYFGQSVTEGGRIQLVSLTENLLLDSVALNKYAEAETGILAGGATVTFDDEASGLHAVTGLNGAADSVTLQNVRGANKIKLLFKAVGDSAVRVTADGQSVEVALPASNEDEVGYDEAIVEINVPSGAALTVSGLAGQVRLDAVDFSGVGTPSVRPSAAPTQAPAAPQPAGTSVIPFAVGGLVVFLAALALYVRAMLHKK